LINAARDAAGLRSKAERHEANTAGATYSISEDLCPSESAPVAASSLNEVVALFSPVCMPDLREEDELVSKLRLRGIVSVDPGSVNS